MKAILWPMQAGASSNMERDIEHDMEVPVCYAPSLIFGARATYLYYFISYTSAYHLCVLPARLSTLLDSFRT